MTTTPAARPAASSSAARAGRLFFLQLSGDHIWSANPDGSDARTIVAKTGHWPDGIAVDVEAGHIYWTNMGVPTENDGSIERVDLDGRHRTVIVPPGGTHTPKQIHPDKAGRQLYWGDREGMRVMRCNLDGSKLETLVETGHGAEDSHDPSKHCVGIAVDPAQGKFYWTQKGPPNAGLGRIFRASIEMPAGESAASRSDIEVLFDGLPEPIDLVFEPQSRFLYWTDRGEPPRGNTVNRAPVDRPAEPEILVRHMEETIGLSLDVAGRRMFIADFAGSLYVADLDGGDARQLLLGQGNLTGVAYAEI
jgi:DNA-binding beta-propeller fold protein YncE